MSTIAEPGDELNEGGSGKMVRVTGFGLKVTLRGGFERSWSRRRGVRSDMDIGRPGGEVGASVLDEAMVQLWFCGACDDDLDTSPRSSFWCACAVCSGSQTASDLACSTPGYWPVLLGCHMGWDERG